MRIRRMKGVPIEGTFAEVLRAFERSAAFPSHAGTAANYARAIKWAEAVPCSAKFGEGERVLPCQHQQPTLSCSRSAPSLPSPLCPGHSSLARPTESD